MKNISFWMLLGLLFIGLKLGGTINWSWWLVLLPLYGFILIRLIIWIVIFLIALSASPSNKIKVKSKWQQRLEEMQQAQKERDKK